MTVNELLGKFRTLAGDSTEDCSDEFLINTLNWCFNELPNVSDLEKIFYKHETPTLDANGNYKWKINQGFRRLGNILFMNFWTSTGGDPCKLNICHRGVEEFYNRNGLISQRQVGKPCEYTIEQVNDDIYLVIDRPSDVPIILDMGFTGYPMPVKDVDEEIDISAIAENLILSVMKKLWFEETSDFGFSNDIEGYIDNKLLPEAIQQLNKQWGIESPIILGE